MVMIVVEHSSTPKEGRLRRWSRLKTEGETDTDEQPPQNAPATDEGYAAPDPHAMPGGVAIRRGATVPAMPSLVIDEEADVGVDRAEDLPAIEDATVEDPPLTAEEEAIVRDLPPFESLNKESDFTPFLADKVPEFIRRRALSILWRSDPALAVLDGLNDYDENYRVIDTLISAAKDTIYRVGKGYEKDDEETTAEDSSAEDINADGKDSETINDEASETTDDVTGQPEGQPVEQSADAGDSDAVDADDEAAPDKQPERLSSGSVRKPGDTG
jgi:hypothetical protein